MQRPSFSIYDASAGSGKTYALVKEYLKIILTAAKNDAYRNILAITFTNKAVHEMKGRIVGNLSEFAKDEPNTKAQLLMMELAGDTELSPLQIKNKSKSIIKHIIHNYAAFDISTIDKFTHKVIRAFAHDLNLPMTFEVTLDTENLLVEAVDAIIAQAGEDKTLTKLLVDFTMEKTDDDKSWDISREILETGRLVMNENNRIEIMHFQNKSIEEFIKIKNKLVETCSILEKDSVLQAYTALSIIENNSIDSKSFSAGHFPRHLNHIQNAVLKSTHKRYHEFEDIKINKGANDRLIIEDIIPELLRILSCVYKNYEQLDFYKAFLKNITPLSLLNTVSKELAKIQKEQNVLSIAEFNAIIHSEIQNQPAPFIYERLGERYRHFFIDEFQDTSEMQWQNLIPLIDNALSGADETGQKGTLMIVGDPKQSIYRWRGGKAEQFIALSKEQNPFNNPDKKIEFLDKNYRSYSQIVEFNNEFFGLLSREFENVNYQDLYANHSSQKINSKTGGYVNIRFIQELDNDTEQEELDNVELYLLATLNTIKKVKELGFQYNDIVILTRKRDQGIAIANFLTEERVPLLSSETLMLQNSTEVRLIINLLRFLKNNGDLEAKANFLHYVGTTSQRKVPSHDFVSVGMKHVQVADFEKWLSGCNTRSSGLFSFQEIRKKSLYEATEIIIKKFICTKENNAYVQYLLDIILERDLRDQSGISDFLKYWDKNKEKFSIPSPEGKNAVRIMTIHKSKGLEFPIVIIPFAEEDYGRKPKDKLWINAEVENFGLTKVLIDNSIAVEGFGSAAAEIYNQKKQEELLDNINVLYVALTRAEEQLYIISIMNLDKDEKPTNNNMATFFINYLVGKKMFEASRYEYEFGKNEKLSAINKNIVELKWISPEKNIIDSNSIKIAQRESIMWGTEQEKAVEYGNIIHEILSFIKTSEDAEQVLMKAVESGIITVNQFEKAKKVIHDIVNHKELENYFCLKEDMLNEQLIIQHRENNIKPDRIVFLKNGKVLLLDYKTGKHLPKHKDQLIIYQKAIELMGYKVERKVLVYINEDIEIVEID